MDPYVLHRILAGEAFVSTSITNALLNAVETASYAAIVLLSYVRRTGMHTASKISSSETFGSSNFSNFFACDHDLSTMFKIVANSDLM